MRQVGILIAIYVGMLVGMSAHAEQRRLVIPYNDMVFQGQNKLMLKQEIKRHYPRLNLRQADLVRVRLVAKSKHGRGKASLFVGGRYVDQRGVAGSPQAFRHDVPRSFDRVDFFVPQRDRGVWQIHLEGIIKVRKVVVVVDVQNDRPNPGMQQSCFFNDPGYQGAYFCLGQGQSVPYMADSRLNNEIASISVGPGMIVQFCDGANFTGQCHAIYQSVQNLRVYGRGWNHKISSIRVIRQ
ncbi:MAG: hypothetical protein CL676_03255 [Bdellovibrionaceae bacterium]|nr:hypothetical protein [Pseudobdellovibrionaceae bacterium]